MFSPITHVARMRAQMTSWLAAMALGMVMIQHSATRIDEDPALFR
jgi:hypothetical protein